MKAGKPAREALDQLLAADPQKDVRQVAMIDAAGRVATWTGPSCIRAAGHATGEGYSVQANLMDKDTVWAAMAAAYESAEGDFAERCWQPSTPPRAKAATSADVRAPRSSSSVPPRPASPGWTASSTCASTTTPSRCKSSTACCSSTAPTSR